MRPARAVRWTLLSAALLAAAAAGAGARADGPKDAAPARAALEAAVNRAIDRGVEKLRATQLPDGGWPAVEGQPGATTALAYHTLRTCGVPAGDPAAERAWAALEREYRAGRDRMRTYAAGLTMMAIADHAVTAAPDRAPRKGAKPAPPPKPPAADVAWMNQLVSFLEGCQSTTGAWRYGDAGGYERRGSGTDDHDHSNTQYAVQGLRAAATIGCTVRTETWTSLLRHLVEGQERDGPKVTREASRLPGATSAAFTDRARGWSYFRLDNPRFAQSSPVAYGSMTAGAVAALVIARDRLLDAGKLSAADDRASEAAVRDGVAWLGLHFDVTGNPGRAGWHYYWLYALERAGDLAGVEWMGPHEWYREGARFLVDAQDADGGWRDGVPEPCATSFALLFLRRATRPVTRGSLTPSSEEEPPRWAVAAGLGERDFEDFLDTVVARWRRATADAALDALARGTAGLGERIVLPLLRRMDDPDAAVRRAAHALLARAAGLDFPFDADAPREARVEALLAYEGWALRTAGKLAYDGATGRLAER